MKRLLLAVWVVTIMLLIMQFFWYYPELPQRMASHFNFQGEPDDWMNKSSFAILWFLAVFVVNISVPITIFLVRKGKKNWINVPNHEFWFSSEKRRMKLEGIITGMMTSLMLTVNLLFIFLFHYTYRINVFQTAPYNIWFPVAFIAAIFVISIAFLVKMIRIPRDLD